MALDSDDLSQESIHLSPSNARFSATDFPRSHYNDRHVSRGQLYSQSMSLLPDPIHNGVISSNSRVSVLL
jgi:hypothetical protein